VGSKLYITVPFLSAHPVKCKSNYFYDTNNAGGGRLLRDNADIRNNNNTTWYNCELVLINQSEYDQ